MRFVCKLELCNLYWNFIIKSVSQTNSFIRDQQQQPIAKITSKKAFHLYFDHPSEKFLILITASPHHCCRPQCQFSKRSSYCVIFTIIVFALLVTLDWHIAFNKGNTFTVVGEFSSVLWVSNRGGLPRLQSRRTTTGCPKKVTIGMLLEPLAGTPRVWKLFLRFLVYQNTALFSTFRPPSVTGMTSQLVSIIWWFRPWKPYIFLMHII